MNRVRRLAWPAAVALAVSALAGPPLLQGRTLAWRDSLREYGPLRALVAEALRHGRLPLWDPYDGTGTPLFAQHIHGVLHPASVALALVAPGASIDALLVAYLLLAGWGAGLAARALGASPAAAAVAGVGYLGAGPVLGATSNLVFLAGAASLPWVVAAARHLARGAPAGAALVGLAAAAAALSGDVQVTMVGGVLALAVAWSGGGSRAAARCAAGLGAGAALAGLQLVPAWSFLQRTARALELTPELQRQWALSPWRLPELALPGAFAGRPGPVAAAVFLQLEPGSLFGVPFTPSLFVGGAVLAAAAAGAGDRRVRALALALPVLLWLALGHHLGARQALGGVPLWGAFRYAEKLVVPLTLCLALVAAAGVDRLLRPDAPPRARWLAGGAALAGLAALLAGWWLPVGGWPDAAAAQARAQASAGLAHLAAALLGLAACRALAARSAPLGAAALVALVAGEAIAAAPCALHPMDPPPAPLAARLPREAPPVRLLTPDRGRGDDRSPGALRRAGAFEARLGYPGYNVAARLDNVDVYSGLVSRRFEYLWAGLGDDRWLGLRRFAVTHAAVPAGSDAPAARAATGGGERVLAADGVELWAVPHAPWAGFATEVRAIRSQREVLAAVVGNLRAGRPEVVVEAGAAPGGAPGRVLEARRGVEAVEIEAEADGPATLVIRDAWWPGWEATIDGAPAPVLAADVLVRAVPFPAGRHRLVMRYAPPELGWGLAASGAGLALIALLALAGRRPAGAGRGPPP